MAAPAPASIDATSGLRNASAGSASIANAVSIQAAYISSRDMPPAITACRQCGSITVFPPAVNPRVKVKRTGNITASWMLTTTKKCVRFRESGNAPQRHPAGAAPVVGDIKRAHPAFSGTCAHSRKMSSSQPSSRRSSTQHVVALE